MGSVYNDITIKKNKINKETIVTAIVTLIVAVFDLLKVFGIFVPIGDDTVYTVVSLIVAAVIYWRNQSWTQGGWTGTKIGRAIKEAERNGDLTLHDEVEPNVTWGRHMD